MSHKVKYDSQFLQSFIPGYGSGDYVTYKDDSCSVVFKVVGLVPPSEENWGIYTAPMDKDRDLVVQVKLTRDIQDKNNPYNSLKGVIPGHSWWVSGNHNKGGEYDYIILSKLLELYRPLTETEKVLYTHESV